MAYDPREDRLDLGVHWELSKYLYSAICVLDVQIMEVYGSHDIDTIFVENKVCEWRLIHKIRDIYGSRNTSALQY